MKARWFAVGICFLSSHLSANEAMKNFAVLGSLTTYAFGYVHRSDIGTCTGPTRLLYQTGKDDELGVHTVGASFFDCNLRGGRATQWIDGFRISPTMMVSRWSADSGAGASSASELTFVPRAQFFWPMGPGKVDLLLGVGPSYLSKSNIGARRKSTNFQFSDEFGFGFSDYQETFRLGFSYRHISNADIQKPNNNVDFMGISLTVRIP